MTAKTNSYKKTYMTLKVISWLLCFGLAAGLIITALIKSGHSGDMGLEAIKDKIGTIAYGYGVTVIILAALSIIVKDKIQPTVWMLNIILSGYLFNMTAVYIVFGIWIADNYILKFICEKYKLKYNINKELDARL